jgi:hypothetical protein
MNAFRYAFDITNHAEVNQAAARGSWHAAHLAEQWLTSAEETERWNGMWLAEYGVKPLGGEGWHGDELAALITVCAKRLDSEPNAELRDALRQTLADLERKLDTELREAQAQRDNMSLAERRWEAACERADSEER